MRACTLSTLFPSGIEREIGIGRQERRKINWKGNGEENKKLKKSRKKERKKEKEQNK